MKSRPKVTIYTSTGCSDCKLTRSVLDEVGVQYTEINLDLVPEAVEVVLAANGGYRIVPTLVFADGRVLVEPGRQELLIALAPST